MQSIIIKPLTLSTCPKQEAGILIDEKILTPEAIDDEISQLSKEKLKRLSKNLGFT